MSRCYICLFICSSVDFLWRSAFSVRPCYIVPAPHIHVQQCPPQHSCSKGLEIARESLRVGNMILPLYKLALPRD
ncbi:hypothetical protein F5146DRAFT_213062 [Armillaria mellea]|nr:hypothetical protein F5146DRAFT_213062 [Armillaria mellea]